jgi:NAD(P)-dependent dehydrogenase (short-subunit alcohol dehydrogenase family)
MSKSTSTKKTVLITGCSDGSLGAALATSFHKAGLHVYATTRNPAKMTQLATLGIETLALDVLDQSSIDAAVSKVPRLDILVNNAGSFYAMPISDMSIPQAKELFDLNVWSYLAVTQAFLPLLLESKGMIVNQTSGASVLPIPFQSAYNASKAAIAMFSDCQRLELEPFDITVVDLKSNITKSNARATQEAKGGAVLPKGSLYTPAEEAVESSMNLEEVSKDAMETDEYGEFVVRSLLKKTPPPIVWTGGIKTWLVRFALILPFGTLDGTLKKLTGLDVVAARVGK